MGTTELRRHQHTIEEVRKIIPVRLRMRDASFHKEHHSPGDGDSAGEYADAMTDLVFNAIENAIFWTDKVGDLEKFRDRVEEAFYSLNIAISVCKNSEERDAEFSEQTAGSRH